MPSFFVYARKSSEAEDRQILSIDSQVNELKRFVEAKKLNIVQVFTEAKSAKAPGRPVFNSMMQRLYKGEADGIICWKLDRLARNPVDGGSIIWAMKQHGITISTPFQTYGQSEDNVVWMYLEFGMAQKYVDDLSRNVKRGLKAKSEMGWFPGQAPLGYVNRRRGDGQNVIATDSKRFPLVRKCWDLILAGKHTPAEIRDIANRVWNLRTKGGTPLGRSTLYRMFGNRFYCGAFEYPKGSGRWIEGRHPPMVTADEFETVQRLLGRSRQFPKNRRWFAFTGLIRCGGCGGAVTAEEKHQLICSTCRFKFAHQSRKNCPRCKTTIATMRNPTRLRYVYYHCGRHRFPRCTEPSVEQKDLERQFVALLENVSLPLWLEYWLASKIQRNQPLSDVVREGFLKGDPLVQRRIVTSIFTGLTLKDRNLTAGLEPPFRPRSAVTPESETHRAGALSVAGLEDRVLNATTDIRAGVITLAQTEIASAC